MSPKKTSVFNKFNYRRFESNSSYPIPGSLEDLFDGLYDYIFPFHYFYYPLGHHIPGLKKWIEASKHNGRMYLQRVKYLFVFVFSTIIYLTKFRGPFWEPELVLHKSDPLHFEGLPVRHRNQQALPYELCRANYSFVVTSHVFSVHDGIKIALSKEETRKRDALVDKSRSAGEVFQEYLKAKYPKSQFKCLGYSERRLSLDFPFSI